ncbi:MAG: hypothetical protein ABEH80_05665 [Halobaculum sp.]
MIQPEVVEQYVSIGIFTVGIVLASLSYAAWRRERDRRMATVTVGYAMFAVYGLVVALEPLLVSLAPYATVELLEHGAAVLILAGLVTFFLALIRR